MIVSKQSLEASRIASTDKAIQILNNLCIKKDGTICSANGKSVMFVSPVSDEVKKRLPFKEIKNETDILLSLDTVNELYKAVPKDNMFKGLLEHLEISKEDETNILVNVTDGKRQKDIRCKTFTRQFIDLEKVLGEVLQSQKIGQVAINLKRFLSVVDTIARICPDGSGEVPLYLEIYDKATILRTVNIKTGQRAIAIVFNYKSDSLLWLTESEWEKHILKRDSVKVQVPVPVPVPTNAIPIKKISKLVKLKK